MSFWRKSNQSGGDNSSNSQAGNDIVTTNTTINNITIIKERRSEVQNIANGVREDQVPALAVDTKVEWRRLVDEMTAAVIDRISENDADVIEKFQQPRMQIALGEAQRSYATTPDDDLREVLADLVMDCSREDSRSYRDLILRKCIDVVASLSVRQLNSLAVLTLLDRTAFTNASGPRDLLDSLQELYRPYMNEGALVSSSAEYSYMASLGCGAEFQLTPEAFGGPRLTPTTMLYKAHRSLMYDSFDLTGWPHATAAIQAQIVQPVAGGSLASSDSTPQNLYRLSERFADELLKSEGHRSSVLVENELVSLMGAQGVWRSEEQFVALVQSDYPQLHSLFTVLDQTNALVFRINAVGRMLAYMTAGSRNPLLKRTLESLMLDPSELPDSRSTP